MAATTTKRLVIPTELLRRSCRNHQTKSAPTADSSSKRATNKRTVGDNLKEDESLSPTIKLAESTDSKLVGFVKKEKYISDGEGKNNIRVKDLKTSTEVQIKEELLSPLPQADGYITVSADELDLERTLLGGQSFRWSKNDRSTILGGQEKEHTKLIFTGFVGGNGLQLWREDAARVAFRTLNDVSTDVIVPFLEDYFQLKYKLTHLYEGWSSRDEHLKKCCHLYRGFRILRQDPVENVFSFICATNNNIKRISLMIDKLCKRFGQQIECTKEAPPANEGLFYYNFPTCERLAQEDVFECLRYELGFGYRAKFITETAKLIMSKQASSGHESPRDYLLSLRKLAYKDTCKQLMQFPGIGRKVADCICLMSMDHLNSVPIDCHIYEIVCRNYMPKLRQERKTLTESVHDMIGQYFTELHGPLAGWSTSVLFIAELKHLKQVSGDTDTASKDKSKGDVDGGRRKKPKK